jgi:hypothetical protein
MAITRGYNPGRPPQQRGVTRMPSVNPRAMARINGFVLKAKGAPMSFDALYRHLMESGFQPTESHLAVENYLRSMRKR